MPDAYCRFPLPLSLSVADPCVSTSGGKDAPQADGTSVTITFTNLPPGRISAGHLGLQVPPSAPSAWEVEYGTRFDWRTGQERGSVRCLGTEVRISVHGDVTVDDVTLGTSYYDSNCEATGAARRACLALEAAGLEPMSGAVPLGIEVAPGWGTLRFAAAQLASAVGGLAELCRADKARGSRLLLCCWPRYPRLSGSTDLAQLASTAGFGVGFGRVGAVYILGASDATVPLADIICPVTVEIGDAHDPRDRWLAEVVARWMATSDKATSLRAAVANALSQARVAVDA